MAPEAHRSSTRENGFSGLFGHALERFREVVQRCQDIERILTEQLPTLEKLAQGQE